MSDDNVVESAKDRWSTHQSRITIVALLFGIFWAVVTLWAQYKLNKEPAIELTIGAQKLDPVKLRPQDTNFYLAVTVTAKNVGTRNLTMCFEDPVDHFLSNCDADSPPPGQFAKFLKDETEVLQNHRYEILVDNDQDEIAKFKTNPGQSTGWNKEKEADFDKKLNKLQKMQGKGTEGLRRPHIPPINVTPVVYDSSLSGFAFGQPITAELWREDKHAPKQWLKGLYIRAGQTEKFTTLVPVPCAGLYRIGFAVRLPRDQTGLSHALEPIWSTSEFFVVENNGNTTAHGGDSRNSVIPTNRNMGKSGCLSTGP